MREDFLNGAVALFAGDARDALRDLPDASVDAVVTDPPYALTQDKKGGTGEASLNLDSPAGRSRISTGGFMGQQWDTGEVAFDPAFWKEVLRVLKPGGHLAAFGGTRTYHRLACAIEDAGFEIRDQIAWTFGQGFPKSLDVSQAIDKAARGVPQGGADPTSPNHGKFKSGTSSENPSGRGFGAGPGQFMAEKGSDGPTRELVAVAKPWQGWGTALKPAWEPICLARKPLGEDTVAENVIKHGTGALNIDACRVETSEDLSGGAYAENGGRGVSQSLRPGGGMNQPGKTVGRPFVPPTGRWPANLAHDGSDEVVAAFPDAGGGDQRGRGNGSRPGGFGDVGADRGTAEPNSVLYSDTGSAARFFFAAKADIDDRLGSLHPTVKPVDLMQWLCRLVTPPGGLVLDPFAGTGTTGEAAWREGFRSILVERETAFQIDIRRRMELCKASRAERRRAAVKASGKLKDESGLPLFGGGGE